MKVVDTFDKTVIELPHQIICMADGCKLSARIWMPDDALKHPVPAIVEHLPYRKRDGTIVRDQFTHPWFAGHGYVCIRVDMRGNGDSEGVMEDEYTQRELDDACEVIAWAAAQPFCSGTVGMMGISWGGFNSLQVAAMRPPALKAIITLCSTVDRYRDDIHYKGGCLLGENIGWAANMLAYSSRPPDPMLVGDNWRSLWIERLENMPFLASTWLAHQHRDAYWRHGSVCEDYGAITAAVLSIGGWHDGYRNTISHLVENIHSPVKGIVGPWIHKYPHFAAPAPAIGFLQEAKRWWDRWLKDKPTGVEDDPDYRVWLMDSIAPQRWLPARPGRWLAEQKWPSDNIEMQVWHLGVRQNGGADLLILSRQLHSSDRSDTLSEKVSSAQSCGQAAGEYFPFAFGPELPDEQSADDRESVCFDSDLLKHCVDIVGTPCIELTLIPEGTAANLCVRLCDIRPDGQSALISLGLLNVCHHQSSEAPQPLIPGQAVQVSLSLDQIAYRLPAGHRLRIAISNSYWPFIWPCRENGTFFVEHGTLALPIRQGPLAQHDEVRFEEPEGAPAWRSEMLRATDSTRDVNTDSETGVISTIINNDFGENRDLQHGLISGGVARERWSIHPDDPLSAKVIIEWEHTGGREAQQWSTAATISMTCDAHHFFVSGYLVAYEGDNMIFDAEYADSIVREFV